MARSSPVSRRDGPLTGYECDGCGACCRTFMVLVSAEDAAREPRIADEGLALPDHHATTHWRYQLYPLPFHECCCLLDGENRCTVYATRPQVCRDFTAGSDRCQEARRHQGLPELSPSTVQDDGAACRACS